MKLKVSPKVQVSDSTHPPTTETVIEAKRIQAAARTLFEATVEIWTQEQVET